jgi:CRP-like cAMP-binding protein
MADLIHRVLLLGRVEAFADLSSEQLSLLGLLARPERHEMGAAIYEAGDAPRAMYLVTDGLVVLERDGSVIAEVRPGEDFGTWALFDPQPRLTAARAKSAVELLRIDRRGFEDLVEDRPDLAHGMLRSLARRIRTLTRIIEGDDDQRSSGEARL